MLTMSKLNTFLFQAAFCFVICGFTAGAERKCAEYNEYCQDHWECCSNTCLTYSYRCIGKNRPSSTMEKPNLSLDDLLESIYNANMIAANKHNQSLIGAGQESGANENKLLDDNSAREADAKEPVLQDRFAAVEGPSGISATANGLDLISFVLQPQEVATPRRSKQLEQQTQVVQATPDTTTEGTTTTVNAEIGAEAAADSDDAQKAEVQCKGIGEKCYSFDECCSQRCHGFLHKCVT